MNCVSNLQEKIQDCVAMLRLCSVTVSMRRDLKDQRAGTRRHAVENPGSQWWRRVAMNNAVKGKEFSSWKDLTAHVSGVKLDGWITRDIGLLYRNFPVQRRDWKKRAKDSQPQRRINERSSYNASKKNRKESKNHHAINLGGSGCSYTTWQKKAGS